MDFSSILITVTIFVIPHVGGNVAVFGGCPDEFEKHGDQCFKVLAIQANWADAKEFCNVMGSDLVQITDAKVQTIINQLIEKHSGIVANQRYWVDGSDMLKTRVWRWMGADGHSVPFTYTNWNPGEPSNVLENCVEVRKDASGRWNDLPCDDKISFICQACPGVSD